MKTIVPFIVAVTQLFAIGCTNYRETIALDVPDIGIEIPDVGMKLTTRNKYSIFSHHKGGGEIEIDRSKTSFFAELFPGVYSYDGIPVMMTQDAAKWGGTGDWSSSSTMGEFLTTLCVFLQFPNLEYHSGAWSTEIKTMTGDEHYRGGNSGGDSFLTVRETSKARAFTLVAWLCFPCETAIELPKGKRFHTRELNFNSSNGDSQLYAAEAYGVAMKLKDMERNGRIPVGIKTAYRVSGYLGDTEFKIHKFEKIPDEVYKYKFVIGCGGDFQDGDTGRLQENFSRWVKKEYADQNPGRSLTCVFVLFDEWNFEKRIVSGRVQVLNVTPLQMHYDPLARKGSFSARLPEGRYAEARRYVRRQIADFIMDKNIEMTTGERPPDGLFKIRDESLVDGVLTIEFTTE